MHELTHKLFSLAVLTYVGFLGLINVLMFLPALGLLPDNILSAMGHFGSFLNTGETHDLIHEFVFALIVGTAAVGLLTQLWKPKESFAGQLVALVVWGTMILTALTTNKWVPQPLFIIFGGLTLTATIIHPAGRGFYTWFRTARVNRTLLALVIIAAVPLVSFAVTNISLQRVGANVNQGDNAESINLFGHKIPKHGGREENATQSVDSGDMTMDGEAGHDDQKHSNLGHYRNLAALIFIIIVVGALTSLRPAGWRIAAWIAGGLPMLLGLASIVLPDAESSLGLTWGLVAIAWGVMFIATAEFTRRKELKEAQEL